MHSFPDHILILFLNARRVGSFLILSSRVFQRELPLKDSDSNPKPIFLIVGNLQRILSLDYILHASFHELLIKASYAIQATVVNGNQQEFTLQENYKFVF